MKKTGKKVNIIMKKKIILSVLMVLLFAAAVFVVVKENAPAKQEQSEAVTEETQVQPVEQAAEEETEAEPVLIEAIDYDALYNAFEPGRVIGTIGEREISWEEYYGWLSYYAAQMENTMSTYRQYYGMIYNLSDDSGDGTGATYADMLPQSAELNLVSAYTIRMMVEESGLELNEDNLENIEQQKQSDMEYCGCSTEEEFLEYIGQLHLSEEIYDYMTSYPEYLDLLKTWMYGESFENLEESAITDYIEENGYMNVNHILLLTKDMTTGEDLDEAAKAEKLEKAEELLRQLKQIGDKDELVAVFRELKDEYCEDSGKITNPDGYVFTKGTMVEEFEAAAEQLEDYGLSEIVETTYGYHILLRLPMTGETMIEDSDSGETVSLRSYVADMGLSDTLTKKAEEMEFAPTGDFKLKMTDYIIKVEA